ncbi:MAG TPA: cytochrome c peroxidase [Gemmatimonadaceae bacterium]|jgi:cytochrome c peroxidase|nr:cytochrome c peroxidase [Gemmatimonadaceae bacterium]
MRAVIERRADSLDAALAALGAALSARGYAPLDVRKSFRESRAQYKRVEGILEFYAPALAAAFNSRRQEVDDDDAPPPSTLAAAGFPALETLVWPSVAPRDADAAQKIVEGMRPAVTRLRGLAATIVPTDAQIIELARLEMARVSTLGIAGFDAPRTHEAMAECADALEGIRSLFAEIGHRWSEHARGRRAVDSTFARAEQYLRAHPDFDSFDRLTFIAEYAAPAAKALDDIRVAIATTPIRMPRGWRSDAPSVYSPGAFDPHAYANTSAPSPTAAIVALGERLFNEPRLSGNGTRSCASCHVPSNAFADGIAKAVNVRGAGTVFRNTPTLINAGLQPAQFADERAVTLEDQVIEVLLSPAEMGGSVEHAADTLAHDDSYRRDFGSAFGAAPPTAVTPLRVRQALAAYVRSLVAMHSRFDEAVQGNERALTAQERRGFSIFMGKAGCGTCHFAPLFSGNTPPLYLSSDVEVIGTPASPLRPAIPDADSGRARIDHLPAHLRAFKTPSLRNVALTAPYMHHGAFATLDQVIKFYDAGGARGAGARVANQTLSADSLHLTAEERAAIVAFLGSLTDTAGTGAHKHY